MLKKTLFICAMAASVAACVEQRREEYVMGYELVPACTSTYTSCMRPFIPCMTCTRPQPKQVIVVLPPEPQPVVEHEIIYQPQSSCGCKKCDCNKKKTK